MEELSHVGMMNCWICGEGAEIILDMKLRKSLPQNIGSRPDIVCNECKNQCEENEGIWLISVKDGEEPPDNEIFNPYRTGSMILIKKSALRDLFKQSLDEPLQDQMIRMVNKGYYFFLEDSVWDLYGLPRGSEE